MLLILSACNPHLSQSRRPAQAPISVVNPLPPLAQPQPAPQRVARTPVLPAPAPATGQAANPTAPQISPANPAGQIAPPSVDPVVPGQEPIPGLMEVPAPNFSGTLPASEIGPSAGGTPSENRFSAPPAPPVQASVPRVALLLPLSGPHAKLGRALLNAAQLALFHFADKQFELLPQDTGGTPQGAADAAALAIGDGAALILGPLFSSSVAAVKPAADAAGLSVLAFSNDQRVAGNGIFTMGFQPDEQVSQVVRFAFKKGLRKFALLAPDNSYGETVTRALQAVAAEVGAEIASTEYYDPRATEFDPLIRRLADYENRRQNLLAQRKDLEARDDEIALQALKRLENLQTLGDVPFDALLIADGGKRLQAIAALLPYYDIDPKKTRMLGTGQWDAPGVGAEPALVGGWFAAPSAAARRSFEGQYKEIFGQSPPRLATLAYDATALAAVFVKPDGSFDPNEITAPQGFSGRDGIFRFSPEGYAQRGLSVYQVRDRDTREIQKSPNSFDNIIN